MIPAAATSINASIFISDFLYRLRRGPQVSVMETCFNLDRQLPRALPAYTCARQYSLALPTALVSNASTAWACEAQCDARSECVAYTWASAAGACYLASSIPSSTAQPLALASGPSPAASQTCVNGPRLMSAALNSTAQNGTYVQATSRWHYCKSQPLGSGFDLTSAGAVSILGAQSLALAGNASNTYAAVRECSRLCSGISGCQLFSLSWRSEADSSPTCLHLAWRATAPITGLPNGGNGTSNAVLLTCLLMDSAQLFPSTGSGYSHVRPEPVGVQAYGSKQYSLYWQPGATRDVAAAVCQSLDGGRGGGQLAAVSSQAEITILGALLRGSLPAGTPAAAWTGLQWLDGNRSTVLGTAAAACVGWCSGFGNVTGVPGLAPVSPTAGSPGCVQLIAPSSATSAALLSVAGCADALPAFVCEQRMPSLSAGGNSAAPLQLFPARTGFDKAGALAAAAGAVLAVVDLSGGAAGRRHARALAAQSGADAAARFQSIAAAAAACGTGQLQSSGCWLQLSPPANACSVAQSPLCGARALLVLDPLSATATTLAGLTAAGASPLAANTACLAASSNATDAGSLLPVPCSTPAAFLASVVDLEAPLRRTQALVAVPAQPADKTLSGGAIAGIVVGCAAAVCAAAVLAFVLHRRHQHRPEARYVDAKAAAADATPVEARQPRGEVNQHETDATTSAATDTLSGSTPGLQVVTDASLQTSSVTEAYNRSSPGGARLVGGHAGDSYTATQQLGSSQGVGVVTAGDPYLVGTAGPGCVDWTRPCCPPAALRGTWTRLCRMA